MPRSHGSIRPPRTAAGVPRTAPGETVKAYLSAGYGFKEPTVWGNFSASLMPMSLADVNGDGKADLLGRESNGTVKVYLSNSSAFQNQTVWGGFLDALMPMYVAGPAG